MLHTKLSPPIDVATNKDIIRELMIFRNHVCKLKNTKTSYHLGKIVTECIMNVEKDFKMMQHARPQETLDPAKDGE